MAASLSEFALEIILGLVKNAVQKVVDVSVLAYFEQRKVNRRVEDAVADVVEPLLPFLEQENISEEKQRRLLQTCVDELSPLSEEPEKFFQGSLNGQKIFDNLYANRPLPEVIIEDNVKEIYILLFPRVAELLSKVPVAVKGWESIAWAENYRRLDELVSELRALFNQVDELRHKPENQADEILGRVRRSLVQKIGLEMDITGLRGDQPLSGKLSEFFVHPAIQELIEDEDKKPRTLTNAADDFAQFVLPHKKNIIIGVAGAGKSTWTKWLQREILNPNNRGFGVRIELRNCKHDSLPSIHDLVRGTAGKHFAEELTIEVISRWLDNHLLVFILDGFDEIASNERDVVFSWIGELCQAARDCPVVITSRPITTDHLNQADVFYARWIMEPFDLPRVIDYIQHWYEHVPLLADTDRMVDATILANEWQDDPTLAPLTGNPLLLSTLLMVHHLDGSLPSGRSRLYQRYIEGMLGLWDDRRKLTTTIVTLTQMQKKLILRNLALFMFLQERDQLEETSVLEWLQGFLKAKGISESAVDVLCVLCERSGLIIGPGVYNFAHKSIAEYLVAEIVWDGDHNDSAGQRIDRMYLFEQRDNDRWNSIIFLWAGLAPVAALVTFIELCLDVKNYALAYGILYDQYDRISDRETRRHLLIPNLQKSQNRALFENSNSAVWFGLDGAPSDIEISFRVPTISLRGVVMSASYDDLIELAIDTEALTLQDRLSATSEELINTLWLTWGRYKNDDSDKFIEYIHSRFPTCDSDENWSIYIVDGLLYQTLISDKNIDLTFEFCHAILPDFGGLLPLLLMSAICSMIEISPHLNNEDQNINWIIKVLDVLPESSKGKVYPAWLLETKDWSFQFSGINNVDLFVLFRKSIEKLARNGALPRDEAFNRTLKYVDALEEQRTALAIQMGVDLDAKAKAAKSKRSRRRSIHDVSKENST